MRHQYKNLIEKWLEGKARCCMPKSARSTQSEYVISADASSLPDAIKAIVTRECVTNYMQLKAISCSISSDIKGQEKNPDFHLQRIYLSQMKFSELDKWLFNLIAWILSPMLFWAKMVLLGFLNIKPQK